MGWRRLGIELCEECPCPFCLGVMDRFGTQCESCMAGGDKTVNHINIRDDMYAHARRTHCSKAGGVRDNPLAGSG